MIWLINYFADSFGNSAILKGGMELRLLGCPRYTNDIDYVFAPFSSKKDVCRLVLDALKKAPELEVRHSMNSKCCRCICAYRGIQAQIEINAAQECASQELTTASLAYAHHQQGRIIRAMRFDVALAHKIAAWNERRLIRDLYDCSFMCAVLDVRPHIPTLARRLARSEIRAGRKSSIISMTITELAHKLDAALTALTQAAVEEQMQDFLAPEELPGLEKKIRIGVHKLLDALQNTQ